MTDYTELKQLAEHHQSLGHAYTVAKPSDILAMIAENDVLTKIFNDAPDLPDTDVEWLEKTRALEGERDQIRAEVAGLKTGYEAYEQVVQGLKAENEALRNNADLLSLLPELDEALEDLEIHGQHSDQGYRKLKDWYRKIDLACKAIDAAMSKEPSHG